MPASILAVSLPIWFLLWGDLLRSRLRSTSSRPVHVIDMALTSLLIPWLSVFWRMYGSFRYRVFFL